MGATVLKATCEECGLPLISFGKPRQRACLDPKCGKDDSEPSNEVVGSCPECESDLIKESGRYGEFIGCSGFPKCRFTKSLDEAEGENKTAKKSTGKVSVKNTAKKSTAKKSNAKKSNAKKSTVKKSTAKKTAKKSTGKAGVKKTTRTAVKKTKTPAKKDQKE